MKKLLFKLIFVHMIDTFLSYEISFFLLRVLLQYYEFKDVILNHLNVVRLQACMNSWDIRQSYKLL